jgi:PHP family Zn ribbon phosphoesterase
MTVGVMHRVEALADRPEGTIPPGAIPFRRLVPLEEIIAEALGVGTGTQAVEREYRQLISVCGSELSVLLRAQDGALHAATSERIVEGILRMRRGELRVEPGYDGEYGTVRIFGEGELTTASQEQQMTLF